MKRTTLFLAGLALMAAGCTDTEIVNNNAPETSQSINFAAYTSKLTRALQTDVTTSNLTSFKVTAIGNNSIYFEDVVFTKGVDVWESADEHIWPNYPLDFYAYNTPENDSDVDPTGFVSYIKLDDNKNIKVTPAKELAHQEDFVVAKALRQTSAGTSTNEHHAVNLTFKHYLTQIILHAKNSYTERYKVEVKEAQIKHIAGSGIYYFAADKMTADANSMIDYSASFTSKTLTNVAHEVMTDDGGGKAYLVPQNINPWVQSTDPTNTSKGAYLALKVKITTVDGARFYPATGEDEYAWMAVPMPSVDANERIYDYAPGKKYTIILNFFSERTSAGYVDPEEPGDLDGDGDADDDKGLPIGGNVIKFNASVDDWDTTNTTITINL